MVLRLHEYVWIELHPKMESDKFQISSFYLFQPLFLLRGQKKTNSLSAITTESVISVRYINFVRYKFVYSGQPIRWYDRWLVFEMKFFIIFTSVRRGGGWMEVLLHRGVIFHRESWRCWFLLKMILFLCEKNFFLVTTICSFTNPFDQTNDKEKDERKNDQSCYDRNHNVQF